MSATDSLIQIIASFYSQFNWVDFLIIAIFLFYLIEGYAVGFLIGAIDFFSFLVSFVLALKYYALVASFLTSLFSLSIGFSNALGFMLIAFLVEVLMSLVLKRFLITKVLKNILSLTSFIRINNILGIIPGFLSSLVLVTFFLTLIVSLPLSPILKKNILNSKIGSVIVNSSQSLEKNLNNVFGGAVSDTLNFITIEPKSNESVLLNFRLNEFSVDFKTEQDMLILVNKEREREGVEPLIFDEDLASVGRLHCEDMFKRGYFSHYTPEGFSPFDRMDRAGISYSYAGENLALAPDVTTAMRGLMQSPGHRENILSSNFGKVGIGVIDGGIYGEMFCQEFSD